MLRESNLISPLDSVNAFVQALRKFVFPEPNYLISCIREMPGNRHITLSVP